ncbi:TauD/TfdA family dioxygenase [Streptomyces sp. CBMA123]|uniref:TauD/TfdA family dioxygenase n=1 Tax=Streptomyces sp. CBMA123 TaxID=1896313 RepID=UPI001661913D|nr:TauD/TfdA family dioxygenase [Streptomyces sp. CBMA123]
MDFFALDSWTEPPGELRERIGATLRERGIAGLTGARGRHDALKVARLLLAELHPHRDSGPDGLTTIRDTGRQGHRMGLAGLGHSDLAVHTESSQLPSPPRLVILVCLQPGRAGGESILVDGRAVLGELAGFRPAALEALSAPRAAYFGGADGLFAPVLEDLPSRRWRVRLRQDELARFSPEAQAQMPALRTAIARHTVSVRLTAGQAILLDNHRFLHGRAAFTGERLLLRALGPAHSALGLEPGFAAPWSAAEGAKDSACPAPAGRTGPAAVKPC